MRVLGLVVGFVLCLTAMVQVDRPRAQSDSSFRLSVCNLSDVHTVDMVILYSESPGAWTLRGYYYVDDTGCTNMGSWPRSVFYTYFVGTGPNRERFHWGRGDSYQCVPRGRFTRKVGSEDYQCQTGDRRLPFTRHQVSAGSNVYELNLR
jgi:hypothetical protein